MEKHIYEGKDIEEIKEQIENELNIKETDYYIKYDEAKAGLFKGKKVIAEVILKKDVVTYVKEFLKNITTLMGVNIQVESKIRDGQIHMNLISDNNPILIGKNGKTLESLQIILKQVLNTELNIPVNVILDIEGYKDKKKRNIEYLAKKTAREVARTKVEARLVEMNSYERRVVHTVLADDKYVYTESIGDEPNRAVVIKPKDA